MKQFTGTKVETGKGPLQQERNAKSEIDEKIKKGEPENIPAEKK